MATIDANISQSRDEGGDRNDDDGLLQRTSSSDWRLLDTAAALSASPTSVPAVDNRLIYTVTHVYQRAQLPVHRHGT